MVVELVKIVQVMWVCSLEMAVLFFDIYQSALWFVIEFESYDWYLGYSGLLAGYV